ncbi:MAG: sulfatase-like hydrolase/transferase [Bacteroides sp.]|uniref:LTA synthase family protein n=1 Tax=Bacteroides sp. TaxID=29523 RepID=UPI002FC60F83
MNIYKERISQIFSPFLSIIINLFLVYICFFVCRLSFLLVNLSYYPDLTASHLLEMFGGGLLFDTSAILYTNALYILLMLFPLHYKETASYQKFIKGLFVVTNAVIIIMNLMDTVYFQYTNRRTTASVFSQFKHEDNLGGIVGIELLHNWYLVLLAALLIVGLYKLYRKPSTAFDSRLWVYYISRTAILAAVVPFCIFGMRGGIGYAVRPITISNANQYVNRPVETAIVLNTPFSIFRTIGKKPFTNPHYFADIAELEQIYTPVHQPADSAKLRKMNVVVLIMESFGKEYFGALNKDLENGQYKGYTPFLDSLVHQSLTFEYSFANGRSSIDGMPSILSGIPKFLESFFLTPASLNNLSSIGSELKKEGYYTAFFHGAQNGSMGFEAYARTVGYTDYFGRTEYNNDADFDGRWAIWDEEFLQFMADKLSTFQQPFSVGLFSASSHHPYVIPDRYKGVFADGPLEIHKCVRYTDNALRLFFEKVSKEPWFKNTLFVITADHTNQTDHPEYQTELGVYSVPIIFYTPNGDLVGHVNSIAQQADIMPTVLGYLGYEKPYVAFGNDLIHTPIDKRYAVSYTNGVYQFVKGNYFMQFDGTKTTAIYDFVNDRLLTKNLKDRIPEQAGMETELKALIQQYMQRMEENRLVVK